MLAEHRAAWAQRWDAVDIGSRRPGPAGRALRTVSAVVQRQSPDESAVGARGLSGRGYAGHVFWDADVFVLPAMVSIDPRAARAMVRYRLRRLGAARSLAAAGVRGARFPWESAATGEDVTPRSGRLGGTVSADPYRRAGGAHHRRCRVGRRALARRGPAGGVPPAEMPLLVETARYWASRCAPRC